MRLIVQKYGGTSVGTPERIRMSRDGLLETQRDNCRVVAVISAMAGVTDNLIKLRAKCFAKSDAARNGYSARDGRAGSIALDRDGGQRSRRQSDFVTGAQAGILTDRVHTKAKIANITPRQIQELLADDYIVIVAGFQGQTPEGETTTLGRGGSDLTAIALAGALEADACQIFTDVDGVFTCDPRVVAEAKKIDEIAYDELLEMAGAGSKVMQSRAVEFAKKFGVHSKCDPVSKAKRAQSQKKQTTNMEDVVMRGVSIDRKQAKVTITGVPDRAGIAARIFSAIAAANIIVDMIVQNVSTRAITDISFTIHEADLKQTKELLDPVVKEIGATELISQSGVAKLSVVGIGMRSHSGVAARLFQCLAKADINIQLISTSDIKIAVIIDESELERAARLTHEEFGLARLAPSIGLTSAATSSA